jgi:Na+-driven multidrug efflux pump
MWLYSFYTMADGFFVARGVGPMALASVNIAMPYINFIFGLSMLCSVGASTVTAIYLGRGETDNASDAFMTSMTSLFAASLLVAVCSFAFTGKLAAFLGATPRLDAGVTEYLSIIACFTPFFVMTYFFEVMSRVDGHPRLAAISVALAGATNIVLDYLFVLVLGWGIKGAAYATGIAQTLPAVMLCAHLKFRGRRLNFRAFTYKLSYVLRGFRLGLGDSVTEFSVGAVIFLFNHRVLDIIGEEGLTSYTVTAYATTLAIMTMCGISQGMMPITSYSHGKRDMDTSRRVLRLALITATACGMSWFLISEIFASGIASIFINAEANPEIHSDTVRAFRIYAASFSLIGINIVLATFFSTVERPLYGIILSSCRGLFVIAASLYAMSGIFGAPGIWLSPTVSEAVCAAIGVTMLTRMYKRGGGHDG